MADTGVDKEKIARLAAMAEASRLGGKGSIRRKHAPVHKTSSAQDDKRLQQVLKRLNMNVVPGACTCVVGVPLFAKRSHPPFPSRCRH